MLFWRSKVLQNFRIPEENTSKVSVMQPRRLLRHPCTCPNPSSRDASSHFAYLKRALACSGHQSAALVVSKRNRLLGNVASLSKELHVIHAFADVGGGCLTFGFQMELS